MILSYGLWIFPIHSDQEIFWRRQYGMVTAAWRSSDTAAAQLSHCPREPCSANDAVWFLMAAAVMFLLTGCAILHLAWDT
jgi:hypothetical protein